MFYVYILQSLKDNKFYIGQTQNINDRLIRHNQGREKSTKQRIPFKLVYSEIFNTRSEALKREHYFKSLKSHSALAKLIFNSDSASLTG